MAFTTASIVRRHLTEFTRTLREVENLPLRITGLQQIELPHKGIKSQSEKIKGKEANQPVGEVLVFAGGQVVLSHAELVPESAVVAKDQSLTVVYSESVDYIVDEKSGKVLRIESGAIDPEQEVAVWYHYFKVYIRDRDYSIDYASGQIRRWLEGDLDEGQMIWIDYEVEAREFSDEMVEQAVEEAHALVSSQIDEKHSDSSDTALEVAETYLALEILARMRGLEVLQSGIVEAAQRSSVSKEYLDLGRSYREEATRLLEAYLKIRPSMTYPRKLRNNPTN